VVVDVSYLVVYMECLDCSIYGIALKYICWQGCAVSV